MLHSLSKLGLAAALVGLLFVPSVSWSEAQDPRVRHVQDDAGLFSKDAKSHANKAVEQIHSRHNKELFIETVENGPKEKDERPKWAQARFNNYKLDGVYVVFSKEPKFYQFRVGDKTLKQGYFTDADIEKLQTLIKNANSYDEKLTKAADYVLEAMDKHHPAKKAANQAEQPKQGQQHQPVVHRDDGEPSWLSTVLPWVCLIVGVLIVVWIIFAIIRAMTGMGGGYGYGGGGGMGYGGGGGGFFTGMLGGMFGAMAGMWIYNNMFGGHATTMSDGSVNWGGGQGSSGGGYQGDTDNTAGGGGEDDGGGGGGGGGKDDDGGKDAGDAGGGGGGDDGGGGGGWFGGGGGGDDAGGGGGGGDWGGGGGGGDAGGGAGCGGGGGGCGGGGGGCGGGGGGD